MGHNAYRDNMYTKEKIIHIRQLLDDTIEQAKAKLPKRVYSNKLIELLFVQPYCTVKQLVDAEIANGLKKLLKEIQK